MLINIRRLLESKVTAKLIKLSTQLYIGWIVFIALLTLIPGKALPQIDWNLFAFDKVIHFTVFSILTFLGCVSFKNGTYLKRTFIQVLISLSIAILYGTFLELMQSFVPDRAFDYADLAANTAGAVIGVAIFLFFTLKYSSSH